MTNDQNIIQFPESSTEIAWSIGHDVAVNIFDKLRDSSGVDEVRVILRDALMDFIYDDGVAETLTGKAAAVDGFCDVLAVLVDTKRIR